MRLESSANKGERKPLAKILVESPAASSVKYINPRLLAPSVTSPSKEKKPVPQEPARVGKQGEYWKDETWRDW